MTGVGGVSRCMETRARTFGEESKFIFTARDDVAVIRRGDTRRITRPAASLIFTQSNPKWCENSLFMRRQLNRANASSCYFCLILSCTSLPRALFGASVEAFAELVQPAEISGDGPINEAGMQLTCFCYITWEGADVSNPE